MSSFIVFLTLAIFIVNCQAEDPPHGPPFLNGASKADFTRCLGEAGLTEDEIKALHEAGKEPTDKQLCFAKCMGIAGGYIDKDGMIATDVIKKNVPPSMVDADTMKTAISCLEGAGKITTCADMSKLLKCLPKPPKRPE